MQYNIELVYTRSLSEGNKSNKMILESLTEKEMKLLLEVVKKQKEVSMIITPIKEEYAA